MTDTTTDITWDCSSLVWVSQPGSSSEPPVSAADLVRVEVSAIRPQHIVEAVRSSGAADRISSSTSVGFDPAVPPLAALGVYESLCALASSRLDVIRPAPAAPIQVEALRRKVSDMHSRATGRTPPRPNGRTLTVVPEPVPQQDQQEDTLCINDPGVPFVTVSSEISAARQIILSVPKTAEEAIPALAVVSAIRHMGPRKGRPELHDGRSTLDLNTIYAGVGELKKTIREEESFDTVKPSQIPDILKKLQSTSEMLPIDVVLQMVGSSPIDSNPVIWSCPKLPEGVIGKSCPRIPRTMQTAAIDPQDQKLRKQKNTIQCDLCDTAPIDPMRLFAESRMVSMYDAPFVLQKEIKAIKERQR